MPRQSISLGRIFGIEIGLDYSWFLVFALLAWSLATAYYPSEFKGWSQGLYWGMGALSAILLFVSVLLHELGHSVVAMRFHIPVRRITLFIFGGVAQIGAEPPSAWSEFLIAIAGPIVSLFLAVLFYGFLVLSHTVFKLPPLIGLFQYLAYVNGALVAFNLIPGFPLDGGRVLRAVVWGATGSLRRSTIIAANVGRFFAFLFILGGVWMIFTGRLIDGLWIAFIGWFLDHAASVQVQNQVFQEHLSGHKVAQAMNHSFTMVPAGITMQKLVDEHILGSGRRCFIVTDDDRAVGMMTVHRIQSVPRGDWPQTTASEVMMPLAELKSISPQTELWEALHEMDRDGVNQLPVTLDHKVVGMLSREDVITFLRTLEELGS